jgi:y4mF family transcriptional regulator
MPVSKSSKTPPASLPVKAGSTRDIGSIVQQVRKEQGLTQIDLAGLAGLGTRFVVELEQGKETIQMQKAMQVLQELGLEIVIRRKGSV